MSGPELIFYSPLYGSNTLTYDVSLTGDVVPTYSNVDDFTSNVYGLQIAASNLGSLFGTNPHTGAPEFDVSPFLTVLADGESNFFSSRDATVSLGGFTVPSLYSLLSNATPSSLTDIEQRRTIIGSPAVSTAGTWFTDLFAQVNSDPTFVRNFSNDVAGAGGVAGVGKLTFLVQYDLTNVFNYQLSGTEYPTTTGDFYYDSVNGVRYSLTSLTETTSGTVTFALRFNIGQ